MTLYTLPGPAGIGITALGMAVPERVISNEHFAGYLDTSAEWIASRTGILERRFAAEGETAAGLGLAAVRDLLAHHPAGLEGVDMVLCATSTPDATFPSTAALIAGAAGLGGAAAADLSVACSGFVYALALAHGQVAAGLARRVLVVGAETMSRAVNQQERNNAVLFGDGAGAAVVGPVPAPYGFGAFTLGADSAGGASLTLPGTAEQLPSGAPLGPALTMNGREVFKFAVRALPESVLQVLARTGLSPAEVDWVVPHQANIRILEAASQRLGVGLERFIINLDRYGNTSAAAVPLALTEAQRDGRLQRGQNIVLVAFGGGLSWAACTLKWWLPEQGE